jgi:hypothetical protein
VHRERGYVGRPHHPPDGQRGAQLCAALVQVLAEQGRGQRGVHEAGRDEVDPDRRGLDREVGDQGWQRGGDRPHDRQPRSPAAAAGTAHEQQRAARPHPAGGLLGHRDGQPDVMVVIEVGSVAVQLGQRRVVRAGAGDQHVVDRPRQVAEEPGERGRVGGVERGGVARADVGRGLLQAVGVPARDDDAGALLAGLAGGFHSDAGAAADHEDGLPGQPRFAGHDVASRRAAAIWPRSAFSPAT